MTSAVVQTARISLVVQVLTGVATLAGFAIPVTSEQYDVSDIYILLAIESGAQLIELVYYSVAVCRFGGAITTWTRYIDWYFSTPAMLISTAMFFAHRRREDLLSVVDIRVAPNMYLAIALNALMLSFGLVAELRLLPRLLSVVLGTAAFTASFSFLGRYVDDADLISVVLFFSMLGVWLLYGVAAVLPYAPKNVMYNLLDVLSKNFYGVFLFVYLLLLE